MARPKKKGDAQTPKKASLFSPSILPMLPYLEMKSNREVTIDGCKGILEYDAEIIRINTGNMVVTFKGRGLNIKCLTTSSIVVEGFILSIAFIS